MERRGGDDAGDPDRVVLQYDAAFLVRADSGRIRLHRSTLRRDLHDRSSVAPRQWYGGLDDDRDRLLFHAAAAVLLVQNRSIPDTVRQLPTSRRHRLGVLDGEDDLDLAADGVAPPGEDG